MLHRQVEVVMKKIFIFLSVFLAVTGIVNADPLTPKQQEKLAVQPSLRDEMDKMILSIADMDILLNRDKVADYEIFVEDADRILKSIAAIRKMDKSGVFKDFLNRLEKPTKSLFKYATAKDARAMQYPEEIFNACFSCHQKHRDMR